MVERSPSPAGTSGPGSAPWSAGFIATLTGAGLLLVFMVQNTESVTLQFLFWTFSCPLWLFTLVVAALGSLVWIGFGIMRRHRRRKARRDARNG